jgi:DNA helicase II / ATP-dependent DNA helicase PcrA
MTHSPDADDLLGDLDPEQREVATSVHGPVVVVAGAGTGKTRAVTRRIAYGVRAGAFDASGVLAVTFTTRAAAEMRARLSQLGVAGVATRTFHSAALSQVRHLWPRLYGRPFADVLDNPEALLGELAMGAGIGASTRDLATEIAWAKVSNVAPHEYAGRATEQRRRVVGTDANDIARLYTTYVDALATLDRVDLEDVLLAAVGVLSTQPSAARVVRQRYRWFTVDEFQDVSALQMRLLECWLGQREDVCVVGDPRQAIYSFAGARPRMLETFTERFPDALRLELTHNYRSTPQVLAVAARVAQHGADQSGAAGLRATRPDGLRVVLRESADQRSEADEVAGAVRALIETGTAERDIAVLTRTRAQVGVVVRALAAAGVSVAVRGGTAFYERPEVRQARRAAVCGRSRAGGSAMEPDAPKDAPPPAVPSLSAAVQDVFIEAGWSIKRPEAVRESSRWESWASIVSLAEDVERTATAAGLLPPGLGELVEHLREQARSGLQPRGSGVTVATLHATKGQQWSAVLVVGAHDGGIPNRAALARTAGPDAVSEERRLLYVGLTRAADYLRVSWARQGDERLARTCAEQVLVQSACRSADVCRYSVARLARLALACAHRRDVGVGGMLTFGGGRHEDADQQPGGRDFRRPRPDSGPRAVVT